MKSILTSVCIILLVGAVFAEPTSNVAVPFADLDGPNEVTLNLYTQGNPSVAEVITLDDDSKSPSFNPDHPTRVVIHGARTSEAYIIVFRDAYISTGKDYNIILVDWSGPASQEYDEGMKSGVQVGHYVGKVLKHMIDNRGLDPDKLIIIGHSMGGHVAGIAGHELGGIVSHVVALDPAANIFDDNPSEDQLDKSDAKFVQVIHTNGGNWGSLESRGHVDFFANGGTFQVGCSTHGHDEICDHAVVVDYYLESITSNNFVATRCPDYNDFINDRCSGNERTVMGEWTPNTVSGNYYFETNTKSPYGKGQAGLLRPTMYIIIIMITLITL